MKKLVFIIFSFILLYGYKIEIKTWEKTDTFYYFLKNNHIPFSLYYSLPIKVRKKLARIKVGEEVFLLYDNNRLKQALIPIDKNKQLQILKKNNKFITRILPIIYETKKQYAEVEINHYLSYDILRTTKLPILTSKIINIFSDKVNFNALPPHTKLKIFYEEKRRFGKIKDVKILFASISNRYYTYNAFLNPYDGKYYDEKGRSLRGMFLKTPVRYKRISSYFGMRFHPILHKWRFHEGIDYVNKIGTPIKVTADGIVIFKGWIKGYGKVVKVKHKNGYISLYAHLHKWVKNLYIGKFVRQGQIIAYVGNTGLSTGPHLHYAVMKNGKWINPLKLKSVKTVLYGKLRKKFFAYIKTLQKNYDIALK